MSLNLTSNRDYRSSSQTNLGRLALANAFSVASLYYNQALAGELGHEWPGDSDTLSFIPAATLVGYALGIGIIAFAPATKMVFSIRTHLMTLAAGLALSAMAPDPSTLTIAGALVGCGAAVAQRLLAAGAVAVGPSNARTAIARLVCAALFTILLVRLSAGEMARLLGWRTVFAGAALCVALTALTVPGRQVMLGLSCVVEGRFAATYFWKRAAVFRQAIAQHCTLFAAYSASWMLILLETSTLERSVVAVCGGAAGISAAFLAGRSVGRWGSRIVMVLSTLSVLVASGLVAPIAYGLGHGAARTALLSLALSIVDAGFQVSLVTNQARVQAILPGQRGRLAACITVCGSLGGALGAGASYWLWQSYGWQPASLFAAASAFVALNSLVFMVETQKIRAAVSDRQPNAANSTELEGEPEHFQGVVRPSIIDAGAYQR